MDALPMSAGTMPTTWMPMCGQSWIGAAASFLGMWTLMMTAMMLPSQVPALWRYRRSAGGAGAPAPLLPTALVALGYLLTWAILGAVVYPLGAAATAASMRHPALERAAPLATGLVVLLAGALQFTRWKAHRLDCCRRGYCGRPSGCGPAVPAGTFGAWGQGLRMGLDCIQCCAGLTAVLLVTGIMDMPVMIAVTGAITLERLAPGGQRVARFIGAALVTAGLCLILRAGGLR
jgi:predicted metal-binding membrane protein